MMTRRCVSHENISTAFLLLLPPLIEEELLPMIQEEQTNECALIGTGTCIVCLSRVWLPI